MAEASVEKTMNNNKIKTKTNKVLIKKKKEQINTGRTIKEADITTTSLIETF